MIDLSRFTNVYEIETNELLGLAETFSSGALADDKTNSDCMAFDLLISPATATSSVKPPTQGVRIFESI